MNPNNCQFYYPLKILFADCKQTTCFSNLVNIGTLTITSGVLCDVSSFLSIVLSIFVPTPLQLCHVRQPGLPWILNEGAYTGPTFFKVWLKDAEMKKKGLWNVFYLLFIIIIRLFCCCPYMFTNVLTKVVNYLGVPSSAS